VYDSYDEETNRKLKEQVINPNFAEEERERLVKELKELFGT
jgi:hypothetical protein